MLLFIKKFILGITFRKIIIIFFVGLFSRVAINYSLNINVFKEYTNVISLCYYVSMASFTVFVNSLTSIDLSVLKISMISEAISLLLFGNNKCMVTNGYFNNNFSTDNSNNRYKPVLQLSAKQYNHSNSTPYSGKQEYKGGNKDYYNTKNKPSVYLPSAGAAWYGMNHVRPSSGSHYVKPTGIINSIYEENQLKKGIDKKDISAPRNPRGTVLSNRGSNVLGYSAMNYIPTNSERPSLDRINSKHSNTGYITAMLDDSISKSNNKNMNSSPRSDELDSLREVTYSELLVVRREKIIEALNNRETIIGRKSSKENFTFTGNNNSSVELSLNYSHPKGKNGFLDSILIKFREKGKRTYQWCIWESKNGNFNDYKEFKKFWDKRGTTLIDLNKKTGYPIRDIVSELVRIRNPFKK